MWPGRAGSSSSSRILVRNPRIGLVGGAVAFIDEHGRQFAEVRYPTADAEIRRAFSSTTPFVHSAVMMRREAFDAAGGYRAPLLPAEDLDLWIRIGAVSELANLAETVVSYRIHAGQSSLAELERQSLAVLAARVCGARTRAGSAGPVRTDGARRSGGSGSSRCFRGGADDRVRPTRRLAREDIEPFR